MRDEKHVRKKLLELKQKHLRRKLHKHLQPLPENCKHNQTHVGTNKEEDGQEEVGLCMLGHENIEEWPGNICEAPEKAEKCPFFNPKRSKEELIEEFKEEMKDPEVLAYEYPDIAALQWVLENEVGLQWSDRWVNRLKVHLTFALLKVNWFVRCLYGAA